MPATGAISRVKLKRRFCPARSSRSLGSSLQRNDAGVWLCEYPGLSFQRSPVCACSLVSSLLLGGATMSQQSALTQSAHSVRQVLTAYMDIHAIGGRCDNLLAGWRLATSSFDRMLGWFPHTSREWIELIIVTVLLWLLMMAIFELELV